ncbi:MAG: hypothetical protein ACPG4T_10865 [Nannocystaceae bacterium]
MQVFAVVFAAALAADPGASAAGQAADRPATGTQDSRAPAKQPPRRPATGVPEGPRLPATAPKPKRRAKPGLAPSTLAPANMPSSQGRADDLGLTRRRDGSYLYVDPGAQFTAEFQSDGTILFADRWRRPDASNPEHGGGFALPPGGFGTGMQTNGPTEWLMYLTGDDPTRRAKAELLKRTRPMRTRLAIAYHLQLLETRFGELHGQLREVVQKPGTNLKQRRELLFALWDDCDESFAFDPGLIPEQAITIIDEARTQTAEKARRAIEMFIAKQLPKGSRRGYRPQELEDMNGRRVSTQVFAPYTPRPQRSVPPAPQPRPTTPPATP